MLNQVCCHHYFSSFRITQLSRTLCSSLSDSERRIIKMRKQVLQIDSKLISSEFPPEQLIRVSSISSEYVHLSRNDSIINLEPQEDLYCKLKQLQSRYTWDLKKEDLELDDLSKQLQHDIDLQLGQRGALAHYYRFLSYVRYLQGKPQEAMLLLTESEEKTRECYGEESEQRLIVTYGDLAWLNYHTEDYAQSESYCHRVSDILVKHPADSSSDFLPEVYGEKGWTFLKFSRLYYTKAKECFSEALKLEPDNWEWNYGYAIALFRTEQDIKKWYPEESPATKQLRRSLEKKPDDGVLLSLLALKLVCYKKHTEAKALVKKALEVGPDNPQVIRYVDNYFRKQDQVDDSIDLLKSMVRKNSQSYSIHHQLALCYEEKKNKLLRQRPQPECDAANDQSGK